MSATATIILALSATAAQARDPLATIQELFTECTTDPTGVCASYINVVAERMWLKGQPLSTLPADTSVAG